MNVEELINEIVEDLAVEIEPTDPHFNRGILVVKVKNAIKEIIQRRSYPETWNDERVFKDLLNYYSVIVNVARYDYNQLGAEGQKSHSESSVTRTWVNRESLFNAVIAFVKVLQ